VWIGVKYLLSHDFLRSKVDHDNHPFCQYQSENKPLACYSFHFCDHRCKQILLILSNNAHEFVRVNQMDISSFWNYLWKKSIQTHLKTQKIKAKNPRWEMAQLLQFAIYFCLATWTLWHFALPIMINWNKV
jgi:hypothetical protein